MRKLSAILLFMLLYSSTTLAATPEETLRRNPYDYATRSELVAEYRAAGDYASAYYHAAWLAWLASHEYADAEQGAKFLRETNTRDRAARERSELLVVILAATESKRLLYNTCLNGAIAQQAARLRRDLSELLNQAKEVAAQQDDPLVRLALAELALSLDDALVFENDRETMQKTRQTVLREAAARAEAVASSLPKSPGAYKRLAIIRGRLATLNNRTALWELAIAEAQRAYDLDPTDASLVEMLWTFHLRAGRWEQAKLWEKRLADSLAACDSD